MRAKRLTVLQANDLTIDNVLAFKRPDCAFYSECLNMAFEKGWAGFACTECTSFQALDPEQAMMDFCRLIICATAAGNVDKTGNAGRKRGRKEK